MSSLCRAARDGRLEEARRLLCQGENIDAKEDGKTPLHVAAEMGRLDVARMLVVDGHANVHAKDEYRRTPLHWAAEKGHLAVARMSVVTGRANVYRRSLGIGPFACHAHIFHARSFY